MLVKTLLMSPAETPVTDRLFYLYFYVPLALLGLMAGFFAAWYACRKGAKLWAGLALLAFPALTFFFYFAVLLTSGLYGAAAKFILLYTFILAPPFWLGGVLALPFIKPAKSDNQNKD